MCLFYTVVLLYMQTRYTIVALEPDYTPWRIRRRDQLSERIEDDLKLGVALGFEIIDALNNLGVLNSELPHPHERANDEHTHFDGL